MIKQLLNSVIAKYRDLSVSRRSIICLSLVICSPLTNHDILLNLVQQLLIINLFVCSLFCLLFLLFSPFLSDSSNASISTRPVINFTNMGANSVENRNRMVYSPTLIFNSHFNLHALALVFINSKRCIVNIKK